MVSNSNVEKKEEKTTHIQSNKKLLYLILKPLSKAVAIQYTGI